MRDPLRKTPLNLRKMNGKLYPQFTHRQILSFVLRHQRMKIEAYKQVQSALRKPFQT